MVTERRLLSGRYQLGEVLGYGGMAEVFHGTDVRLSREVAVKILRADLARDPSFLNRFRREAQAAASLNHPAIVSVYDTGDDEGVPFIVMEYVEGQTLRDFLRSDGRLLPRRALEIVAEVCGALEYSHRSGIVHRDIKPGNVMITPRGEIKVMDFGIARALAASAATATQTAQVMGTAQYLSPEQARGETVDARSDIYSAGCLLYELLTGQPPFQGESAVAVAYQHVREEPIPPSRVEPDLPPALDAVVMKALAKNPANRYQSAAEFRADLDRAAAGRRVEATPLLPQEITTVLAAAPAATAQYAPPPRRRRGRGLVYALLLLLVIGVFVAAAFLTKSLFSGGSGTTMVPSLVGKTAAQATQAARASKVSLRLTEVYIGVDNNHAPKGVVFFQSPPPHSTVAINSPVVADVSAGTERVKVPSVVGESLSKAQADLAQAHLSVSRVKEVDKAGVPPQQVLSQSVSPGTTVPAGSSVDLTVASGNAALPSVVGETQSAATSTLQGDGFTVQVAYTVTSAAAPGSVVNQVPAGPGEQPAGSTVTITVAQAPASPSPTATPTPTASSSGQPPSSPSSPPPGSATPTSSTSPTSSSSGSLLP